MPDRILKASIAQWLESQGFRVTQLPEGQDPSADLLVEKGQRFLVELKTKEDADQLLADIRAAVDRGDVAEFGAPFTPQNTISAVIKSAVKQLHSHPAADRDFALLWLVAAGIDSTAQYEQFRATLYGLADVVGDDDLPRIPCYYFRESAFYRWRDVLDGAVICEGPTCKLCINDHSVRAEALRASDMAICFGRAVEDPRRLEADGSAYIADCPVDRADEQGVISYLLAKYGRSRLMPFNVGTFNAYVEIELPEEGHGPE